MLKALCGSKSVQKILLFLFVNGKCYGTQLHQQLKSPLTPLQKALIRLEKEGLLISYCEGKTRLYQFNPSYPLLSELEPLLRKAYTLLPPHEKKDYFVATDDRRSPSSPNKYKTILSFWEKLSQVSHLTFHASSKSREESGWNGMGKGKIDVTKEGGNLLVYNEKGSWQDAFGNEMSFSNVFRWTLDRQAAMITLEHLRYGAGSPVFLFHLAPSSASTLTSVDSHLCAADSYFGKIFLEQQSLHFHWRVIGPKKNEEIKYYYT